MLSEQAFVKWFENASSIELELILFIFILVFGSICNGVEVRSVRLWAIWLNCDTWLKVRTSLLEPLVDEALLQSCGIWSLIDLSEKELRILSAAKNPLMLSVGGTNAKSGKLYSVSM